MKKEKKPEWLHCWMALGMNYVLVPACRPEAGGDLCRPGPISRHTRPEEQGQSVGRAVKTTGLSGGTGGEGEAT